MSCWRRAVPALLGGLALLCACQARPDEPLVRARPVPLQEDAPERVRLGGLRFEAGFLLTSDDPRFGGLSGLWLAPDGREIMMVSDHGTIWRATLEHTGDRLTGIADWAPIEPGRAPGDPKGRLDAEGMADDGRGGLVVADEGQQRLRRLALDDLSAPAQALPVPAGLARAGNTGIEALTALPGGALLALSEGVRDAQGQLAAWRIDGDRIEPLSYRTIDGFVPTGADRLGDTVYVVERRVSLLSGFTTRVVALDVAEVRPGATLAGQELARLAGPRSATTSKASPRAGRPTAEPCSTWSRTTIFSRSSRPCCCSSRSRVPSGPAGRGRRSSPSAPGRGSAAATPWRPWQPDRPGPR